MSEEPLPPGVIDGEAWDRASALYHQGRRCQEAGDLERAVTLLRESAEAGPHFKTLEVLGELLLELGRPREAIVPLAAATTLNGQVRAPSLLAKALLAEGSRVDARRAAHIAAARDPNNRLARAVLAATEDLAEACGGPTPQPDSL